MTVPAAAYEQISVTEAQQRHRAGAVLLDVREDEEWTAGHAPGAVHHPLSALDPAAIPAGTEILSLCRSGKRSAKAADALHAAGHHVVNVDGGMLAWQAAGLPVLTEAGTPGTV